LNNKKPLKIPTGFFMLIAIIVFLFFGGFGLLIYFISGSWFIFGFMIFMAIMGALMVFFVAIVNKRINDKKGEKSPVKGEIRARSNSKGIVRLNSKCKGSLEEISLESISNKYKIDAYIVLDPPIGEKGMISKMEINPSHDVLQCPQCNSFFIKDYLEEWLKESSFCPVCKYRLRIVQSSN
jgi:uncharacterized membrane protein